MADQTSTNLSKTSPLFAVLAAWFFSPVLAFLRYGRPWLACVYLLIYLVSIAVILYPLFTRYQFDIYFFAPLIITTIAGCVHVYRTLRASDFVFERKWYSHWLIILGLFLTPYVCAFFVKEYVSAPYSIVSHSMLPTLKERDYHFADLRAYTDKEPERGDVVVFRFNNSVSVKRIVGLPGDKVQLINGRLNINSVELPISPLPDYTYRDHTNHEIVAKQFQETLPNGVSYPILSIWDASDFDNTPEFVVPETRYFVLGDNRDGSNDSRADVGFVPRGDLIGKIKS